ncbi:MAG: aminopeptidase P family protein, partial [Proteobacteria bacterium]|nr:aminopeptidase P family protein [Candidatus Avisuccinivibrio stercorigallinarum]
CLVDAIWEDRPEPVLSQVEIYPDEYNGCPSMQKRQNLAKALRDEGFDATVISSPETICWLLNIRGRDRHCLPVINCRLVAYANEALEWYVNSKHLNDDLQGELEQHFGHIDIFPEERFEDMLERLCSARSRVYIDPAATNAAILKKLYEGGADVVEGLGLCEVPKACKNDLELAGEHKAHIKDGTAMCRFLTWLDEYTNLDKNTDAESFARDLEDVTEDTLAQKAEQLRKVEGDYIEASFDTISALGPNAAMCHYNHKNFGTPRQLGLDGMYLIDSGAHYLEGTTDITRTIKVGNNVTPEMMKMFTVVLKCHIALATAVFPRGTSGLQLDALARRPLWDLGLDYEHGTGHGVGHLLSVHEGPQNISSRSSTVPLRPGMIVSIEPGFYKDGEYGIRLENLVVVTPCSAPNMSHMLCFEPLTLVPFDLRLIERELLTAREREWLNNYHQHVYNLITSTATTLSDLELNWLAAATAAI